MKTKRDLFEELTPIEWYGMFNQIEENKRLSRWTIKGLESMKELWHKYYTTSAHRFIGVTIMSISEKQIEWNTLEKVLKESL